MARLVTSGFEINDLRSAGPLTANGNIEAASTNSTVVTSPVRSGTYAIQAGSATGITLAEWFTAATATGYYGRVYVYLSSLPTSGTYIQICQWQTTTGILATIKCDSNGAASLWYNTTSTSLLTGATQVGSDMAGAFSATTWTRVETYTKIGAAGADDEIGGKVGGVTVATATGLTIDTAAPTIWTLYRDNTGSGVTLYADDVAINDSTGAAQTTYPGDGKVVLLKPISNNAVGTGWTLGTGTAMGNGWDAVDNTPPVGVADLAVGSDVKQIRNASANANVNYDANLTTYTNGGIGASDVVNVVLPVIATASPSATSPKAGTVGISANPVVANVALAARGVAGAFYSGVVEGAYPTGWKWSFGTTTYAPAVTLASSPVMRITQVTSSTRIAVVCEMGMYVDYTPAVLATPPRTSTVVLQAVNRSAVW